MATNYVQAGRVVDLPVPGSSVSGDPQLVGDLAVVQLQDEDNGMAQCALEGVYELSVTGDDGSSSPAVAMSAGDPVYSDAGTLNADSTNGTLFGHLLDSVNAGATATVRVRLKQ